MMTLAPPRPAVAAPGGPAQGAQATDRKSAFYRHDLDGLRGIAIALVAVFHVWFGRVSGGVDVFLALSGFFFGGRLLRTALTPGASLWPVPEVTRLVRRLLPALVVVLAAAAVLTILVQPETRWETFADQSLASLGYYQNWELASTAANYLRAGEAVSPLQHIWSMSVQGQFYIGFLALIFLFALLFRRVLGRYMRASLVVLLTALTIASFVYAVFAHNADQAAAYYNSFARAWELLLGALVGALVGYIRWPMWLRTTIAVAALAAILSCGALIDGVKQFPGPWALVPVGATMLFILTGANRFADPHTAGKLPVPNRLLATAPFVWLGSIAYSLYLWHWPILSFARIYVGDTPAWPVRLAGLVAAIVLATATWWFIERPIRGAWVRRWPRRSVGSLATAVAVIGLLGALALNDAFRAESAASARATEVSRAVLDWEEDKADGLPGDVPEAVMFFGDSHMRQYWPRIKQVADGARPTRTVFFQTKNGCAPVPGVDRKGRDCDDFVEQGFARAHAPEVRTVVIGASWYGFVTRTDYYKVGDESGAPLVLLTPKTQWVMEGFEHEVKDLVAHGKQVVILLSSPRNEDLDPKRLLYRDGLTWREREVPKVPLQVVDAESAQVDAVVRGIAERTGASLLDPSDWLCGKQYCPPVDERGRPIYVDGSHVRASIMRERIDALDRFVYADGAVAASVPARPAYAASR